MQKGALARGRGSRVDKKKIPASDKCYIVMAVVAI